MLGRQPKRGVIKERKLNQKHRETKAKEMGNDHATPLPHYLRTAKEEGGKKSVISKYGRG